MSVPPPLPTRLGRPLRSWAVIYFVLALSTYFLFPATEAGGTGTPRGRILTSLFFVLCGVMASLRVERRSAVLHGLIMLATGLVLWGTGTLRPVWPLVVVLMMIVHAVVAPLFGRIWHSVFPADPVSMADRDESGAEIIESIATAFILALIVREFAFEAFKIPTGSMQPTIWGDDYGRRKGDRLLASKAPLLFGDPARWSIMVFKYPLFRPTNYIKRLVGLSGENLQIRKGDIYINGKCVARPEEVQETLWAPVFPDGSFRSGAGTSFISDGVAQWTFGTADAGNGTAASGKTGWAIFETAVSDARITFDLNASDLGDGAALVRIDGDGRRVELEIRQDGFWLTAPGIEKRKVDDEGFENPETERIGLAVADRVVRVSRGGRLIARIESADESNIATGRQNQASLGVSGGTARFAQIRVERDLQYGDVSPGEWQIPEGSYFMLGDNTGQSRDSRLWRANIFRVKEADGSVTEHVADDSVRLDDEHAETNIHDLGDAFEFHDSYGVKRRVAKSSLVDGRSQSEAQPFVRREDLVGRAFLIFYPFPPIGEWRPRILP